MRERDASNKCQVGSSALPIKISRLSRLDATLLPRRGKELYAHINVKSSEERGSALMIRGIAEKNALI